MSTRSGHAVNSSAEKRSPPLNAMGRKSQIYVNGVRQVGACVVIKPSTKQILVISSRKHPDKWVLPKGGWEDFEPTLEACAVRETWEEAGVKGDVKAELGKWKYEAGKEKEEVGVFEMEVRDEEKKWPEEKERERKWVSYDEALKLLNHRKWMNEAVARSSLSR
ncbi:hypothetical protein M427DRAFT_421458 [Gonapodya prolifera JEL478]|uniref:Nudix hydrolase domain-containing protein n=1 Tax=Gonapodya prolifera (strain JEL478) TaxID=1344416 RepID=A0A139A4I3_GONPJ|nr:hypothetical protein M427DRAFT_421458 [Gonapodya prolifera JEL478]|eukprot:KXS11726.1 hypothetical protein M427DRAFT_421458 [Gonapodya prolifera JEL478]